MYYHPILAYVNSKFIIIIIWGKLADHAGDHVVLSQEGIVFGPSPGMESSYPRPPNRWNTQPAMHLMFHQVRVRLRHGQSRSTWRRRCWLRCETRLTAVTCYGAPSTSDLRPSAMTKATSCTLARCPPRTWKRQCQHHPRLDPVRHLHRDM